MEFLIGLLLVGLGLVAVFFGYRFFRILLPFFGGIAGFIIAANLFPNSFVLSLIVGVVIGILLALFAYQAWSVLFTISGVIAGASFGAAIANTLNLWNWVSWLLVIGMAVVVGWLVWKFRDEMVIVITALAGASLVSDGLVRMFGEGTFRTLLWWIVFFALAALGIVFQWGRWLRYNWYRDLGRNVDAAITSAAATDALAKSRAAAAPAVSTGAAVATDAAGAATAAAAEAKRKAAAAAATSQLEADAAAAKLRADQAAAAREADLAAAQLKADQAAIAREVDAAGAEAGREADIATTRLQTDAVEITDDIAEVADNANDAVVVISDTTAATAVALGGADALTPAEKLAALNAHLDTLLNAEGDRSNLHQPVDYLKDINPAEAAQLKGDAVVIVVDVLRRGATQQGRAQMAKTTGVPETTILKWVNFADLLRIQGVGAVYARLLEAVGVDTVVELAQRNPVNLHAKLVEVNAAQKLSDREPSQEEVTNWIAQAKDLPRVIE